MNMNHIINETETIFKKYLTNYGKIASNEIDRMFNILIDIDSINEDMDDDNKDYASNENDGKNNNELNDEKKKKGQDHGSYLLQMAGELSSILKNLCSISAHYPKLMPYLNGDGDDDGTEECIISERADMMSQALDHLRASLGNYETASPVKLHIGVSRCHVLSKLDWFLRSHANCAQGFVDIYVSYQKKFHDNVGYNEILDGIKEENFFSIGTALGQLTGIVHAQGGLQSNAGQTLQKQAQMQVSRKMEEVYIRARSQVIQMGKEIDMKEMNELTAILTTIQEAKQYCIDYLPSKDQEKLSKIELETTKKIEEWMNSILNCVTQLIEARQFRGAIDKIEAIKRVSALMKIKSNKVTVESLEDHLKRVTNEILKRYKVDITMEGKEYNPYTIYPPRTLYENLKPVFDQREIFRTLWDAVNSDILEKFRKELGSAKEGNEQESNRILRLCESVLTSLPDETAKQLETDLKHCREDINKRQESDNKTFNSLKDSQDYSQMSILLREQIGKKNHQMAKKIENDVLVEVSKISNEMETKFANFDANGITTHFDRMLQILQAFEGPYNNMQPGMAGDGNRGFNFTLRQKSIEIRGMVTKYFVKTCENIDIAQSNVQLKQMETETEFLTELIKNGELFFGNDEMKSAFTKFTHKLWQYFKDLETKFINGIGNSDDMKIDFEKCEKALSELMVYQHSRLFVLLQADKDKIPMQYGRAIELLKNKILANINATTEARLMNNTTESHDKARKEYFIGIKDRLSMLIDVAQNQPQLCQKHLQMDVRTMLQKVWNMFEHETQSLCDEIETKIKSSDVNDKGLKLIELNYKVVTAFESNVNGMVKTMSPATATSIEKQVKKVYTSIEDYLANICKQCKDEKTMLHHETFATPLLKLQMASQLLISFREMANEHITECLRTYKSHKKGGITQLAIILETRSATWGGLLVSSHPMFRGQANAMFHRRTNAQGINYVLDKMRCNDNSIEPKRIENRFNKCQEIYRNLVKQYLKPELKYEGIIADIKTKSQSCKDEIHRSQSDHGKKSLMGAVVGALFSSNNGNSKKYKYSWNVIIKEKLIELMAYIFALWTLQNADDYFENKDETKNKGNDDDANAYLYQPREAQIVSILRLLSIDCDDNNNSGNAKEKAKLVNHLIQINTGEGKSLTLAVTSCILALVGFDVNCACYSEYLSRRDYNAFEKLFLALNVTNYIHYGTFDELCERVINSHGNVRNCVEDVILPSNENDKKDDKKGKENENENNAKCRILLIDEIDVFFSSSFHGAVYTPGAKLKHEKINGLIDLIWKIGHGNSNVGSVFYQVKQSNEYKGCRALFGPWGALLEESVKNMLSDLLTFESLEYQVYNGKIGYKQLDKVNTNIVYGYNTLWQYYLEHSKNEISEECLNDNKYISIACGVFSYGEIAKEFNIVLGVTGTLESLSPAQLNVMKKSYDIHRHTYMPSLFGENHFSFNKAKDIKLYEISYFHENVKEEIKMRLNDHAGGERCAFVFFEDKKKLMDFYECKEFAPLKASNEVLIMTEELNKDEKNLCVTQATISGTILLATKSFGRGTDFQVRDHIVRNNGGPHVIETFLSEESSEEKQIMGRTARQGGHGSCSILLIDSELEKYDISNDDLKQACEIDLKTNDNALYDLLNEKRNKRFIKHYRTLDECVQNAKEHHAAGMKLLNGIHGNDLKVVSNILLALNAGASIVGECTKVAVLMDATGSMDQLLLKAKNTVGTMFERISDILKEKNMDPKSFSLQFIAYRNYNAPPSELLKHSGWCNNSQLLIQFLDGINASYGWGHEAIEVAFHHINYLINEKKDNIAQIILIGDMPPNTKEQVIRKRDKRGEEWSKHEQFKNATYWEDELNEIIKNDVAINTFYLNDKAKLSFQEIAQRTKGHCDSLDIDSSKGAETLTNLVSKQVLQASGGAELVKAYEAKYMKGAMHL